MKTAKTARVYVLEGYGDGTLKVGFSVNPERRRSQLGGHLRLVHTTPPMPDASRIEGLTKRLLTLAGQHVAGEVFRASLADITAAIERAERIVAGLEPEPQKPKTTRHRSIRIKRCRTRAAWRFDPRFLERLRRFSDENCLTQTHVIETACTEWMDKKDAEAGRAQR